MGSSSTTSRISSKWIGFVTALWVQAICGNNYAFANYSVALKTILDCNQVQLNNLSVAKDVGKAFGIIAGLLADVLPPWCILLVGSVEGLLGYGMQWLVVSQRIRPLPYWMMSIAMCLGGNSSTWMNTAVLVTCLRNFRSSRGPVSGILKGYVGLSTAIFTDLCAALFTSDPATFVLMLALIPLVVCIVAMIFLRPVEPSHTITEQREEARGFMFLNAVAIFLALYLLSFDFCGPYSALISKIFAGSLLLVLAAPLLLPGYLIIKLSYQDYSTGNACYTSWWSTLCGRFKNRKMGGDIYGVVPLLKDIENLPQEVHGQEKTGSLTDSSEVDRYIEQASMRDCFNTQFDKQGEASIGNDKEAINGKRKPIIGEEHTVLEATQTLDFWLLFTSFLCGVGTGLAVINNLGQIGQSLGYKSVSIFISFTSVWGFFGRLGSGSISEYLIRCGGVPRPLVMAFSQILMIVGYTLLTLSVPGSLYFGTIAVGICFGVRVAVSVPTLSELFGLRSFGLMYNILILNLPLGSFLFSGLLAGLLYDQEARKNQGAGVQGMLNALKKREMYRELWSEEGETNWRGGQKSVGEEAVTCIGGDCYRLVFMWMAIISGVGLVLDLVLAVRTRRLYTSLQRDRSFPTSETPPIAAPSSKSSNKSPSCANVHA